jgi:tRNA pseudouridine55 synthase
MTSIDGLLVVDKPAEWTSHDVVGRLRRLAGTRKVGHAGTLDPMATGVLVLGLGRATRLLGHLAATDKSYEATIRLGQSTVTDDADGDVVQSVSAAHVDVDQVRAQVPTFLGAIQQVPSSVSAIKVAGERAYKRVRDGQTVELPSRPVSVSTFTVGDVRRPTPDLLDVEVFVECSSGTYIRALARDLGQSLGVGGHLTRLRRTRVGQFTLEQAKTLEELERSVEVLPLAAAVETAFPRLVVVGEAATAVRHGRPIPVPVPNEGGAAVATGVTGVFDEAGSVLALMEPRDGQLRVVVGFVG